MKLKVICESGYSGCDHPKALEMDGVRQEIQEVIREWREPGAKHFIVKTNTGQQLKLVFYETTGEWNALEVSDTP